MSILDVYVFPLIQEMIWERESIVDPKQVAFSWVLCISKCSKVSALRSQLSEKRHIDCGSAQLFL